MIRGNTNCSGDEVVRREGAHVERGVTGIEIKGGGGPKWRCGDGLCREGFKRKGTMRMNGWRRTARASTSTELEKCI